MEIEGLTANNEVTRMRAEMEKVVRVFSSHEMSEGKDLGYTMNDLIRTLNHLPDPVVELIYDPGIEKSKMYEFPTKPYFWEAQGLFINLTNFLEGGLNLEMFDREEKILLTPTTDVAKPSTSMLKNIVKSNYRQDGKFTFKPPELFGSENSFWAIIIKNHN